MSRTRLSAIAVAFAMLSTGCASIVSKSNWPFSVDTNPAGAEISVTNRKGIEVYKGTSPAAFKLKSGSSFFAKESYTITLTKSGFETKKMTVECKLNGWYFGNILLGGVIGMLIIDPATGAMYKLDNHGIFETMKTKSANASLQIIEKDQLSKEQEQHLVKLN
ncbi:hypothetical protein QTN47_03485 [Danxiaibacter flavus]|uniref:PEGA domain-containing protein n=1 Tax=Danxiaibacter flavus TaxID=3049108 RepID=A0ABV3ZDP8_9BACT|nr:hypothetical protein QNM32_03485 [Chitinophagaceae bacterium DXS]